MNPAQVLGKSVSLGLGKFSVAPTSLQAVGIVVLLFLLVLSLAQLRRHFIDWSVKGALFGLFIGFLLALIFEGFLIIGGKTALTEIAGWKDPPKPIVKALDAGRAKLVAVLGVTDEIPSSFAKSNPTSEDAIEVLQSLDPTEMKKIKVLICQP